MSEHRKKAVELLAERLYRFAALQQGWSKRWPEITEGTKDSWRQDARLHLEQLDSHLQRMCWERFREAVLTGDPLERDEAAMQERQRIRKALEGQAAECRREAKEALRRGERDGSEKMSSAAGIVDAVTRIIFDFSEGSDV